KYSRGCADADAHRENRHQGEAPLSMNHAKGILKIAAKVGPDTQPPRLAHDFLARCNASEISKCPASCFSFRQSFFDVLSRLPFNVKPDFALEIGFRTAALQKESELADNLSEHHLASTQYVVDGA